VGLVGSATVVAGHCRLVARTAVLESLVDSCSKFGIDDAQFRHVAPNPRFLRHRNLSLFTIGIRPDAAKCDDP
jgi:hypothetical protein